MTKTPNEIWQQAIDAINGVKRLSDAELPDSDKNPGQAYELGRADGLRLAVITLQESGIDTMDSLSSRFQRAKELTILSGISSGNPGYAEVFALALEAVTDEEECHCSSCEPFIGTGYQHSSACAVHNEPAMPKGDCTCGLKVTVSEMRDTGTSLYPSIPGKPEPYNAPMFNVGLPSSVVEVNGYRYGFDEEGAWRRELNAEVWSVRLCTGETDRTFASPVAEAMKKRGFEAKTVIVIPGAIKDSVYVRFFNVETGAYFDFIVRKEQWQASWFDAEKEESITRIYDSRKSLPTSPSFDDAMAAEREEYLRTSKLTFSPTGIAEKPLTCVNCDGALEADRTSVCKTCQPDSQ